MSTGCLARYPRYGYGCIWIGRDHTVPLTWLAGKSRDPVDLTGFGLRAEWRYESGTLIVAQTIGAGITVADQTDVATRGRFTLLLPRATTAELTAGDIIEMDIKVTAGGLDTMFPVRFAYRAKLPTTRI